MSSLVTLHQLYVYAIYSTRLILRIWRGDDEGKNGHELFCITSLSFSWIFHGKLHQTRQRNYLLGLDSNSVYPEYRASWLTAKPISWVGLLRNEELGIFPLDLQCLLKLIFEASTFRCTLRGILQSLSCDGALPNSRNIAVRKRWNFPKRKILENYMVEAVRNWCSSRDVVERLLSARILESTPGFGVTVGA
jgi:hypothetical protein